MSYQTTLDWWISGPEHQWSIDPDDGPYRYKISYIDKTHGLVFYKADTIDEVLDAARDHEEREAEAEQMMSRRGTTWNAEEEKKDDEDGREVLEQARDRGRGRVTRPTGRRTRWYRR